MFRLLAFLITGVFVFNMSVLSIAQELPTIPEVKAEPNSNTDLFLTLTSAATCLGGAVMGGFVGLLIGNRIDDSTSGLGDYTPSQATMYSCIIGAAAGGILMLVITSPSPQPTTPSPNVLLGKSPAYIQAYIQAHPSQNAMLAKP